MGIEQPLECLRLVLRLKGCRALVCHDKSLLLRVSMFLTHDVPEHRHIVHAHDFTRTGEATPPSGCLAFGVTMLPQQA